jgi:putative SOS response-associated peptidase YedK
MCNLYSLTKGQAAIRDWFRASNDRTGNLPLFPGIFPDQMAPIVRNGADGERELVMARWGMPGPPQFGDAPITNIRNVGSPHWRGWLGKQNRCIVPATSFCEYAILSRARRRSGSLSTRIDPCSLSLAYGPRGAALERDLD